MSIARKVAYNTVIQITGRVFGLLLTLVTINYIATFLVVDGSTLTGFGQYTIVFTFVSIIGTAADLGLFTLLVRELVGKTPEEAGAIMGGALWFRAVLFIGFLLLSVLLVGLLPYDVGVKQGILIGVVIAFSMLFSQVIASIFQSQLKADKIVIAETVGKLFIMVATISVLRQGLGLLPVIWVNLLGQAVTLLVSYLMARPLARFVIRPNWVMWRTLLPQFWPIAVVSIMGLAHFKIDTLLLSFMKSAEDVGVYGFAYKLLEVFLIIPSILATNLLPVMTGMAEGNAGQLVQVIRRAGLIMLLIAIPLTIFLLIFAPWLVVFVAHEGFSASVLPLQILSLAMLAIFLTTLLSQAVISVRAQKVLIPAYTLALLLNIGLNLYAIPRFSYLGAAVTTLITETLLLLVMMGAAGKAFKTSLSWPFLLRVTMAGVLACSFLLLLISWFGSLNFPDGRSLQALYLLGAFLAVMASFGLATMLCFGSRPKRLIERVRGLATFE